MQQDLKYAALILVLLAVAANADTFRCQSGDYWSEKGEIVVLATTHSDGDKGTISAAGVTHVAKYRVAGLDRRWDFDPRDDGIYNYAFVIQPNGSAYHLDFSAVDVGEHVNATQFFICKQVTTSASESDPE